MGLLVISKIDLDMTSPGTNIIHAKQCDNSGRVIRAHLLNAGEAWEVPSGVYPVVRYMKPDRIGGFYDEDERNVYAIAFPFSNDRSYIDITIALQALTTAGNVHMEINFYDGTGIRVSSFSWLVKVEPSPLGDDVLISSEYYNALTNAAARVVDAQNNALADLQENYDEYAASMRSFVTQAENARNNAIAYVGAPRVANTIAKMTDKTLVYVYTGQETGYINGNWYYWNGTAWTSGGIYNSTAFSTDASLSSSNLAADSKSVGTLLQSSLLGMFKVPYPSPIILVHGGINNGFDASNTNRVRTGYLRINPYATYLVTVENSNYAIATVWLYTNDNHNSKTRNVATFGSQSAVFTQMDISNNAETYFRCSFMDKTDATLELNDAKMAEVLASLRVYQLTSIGNNTIGGLVGEETIENLECAFKTNLCQVVYTPAIKVGKYIQYKNGIETNSSRFGDTNVFVNPSNRFDAVELNNEDYEFSLRLYTRPYDLTTGAGFISDIHYYYKKGLFYIPKEAEAFALVFQRNDHGIFTDDDADNVLSSLKAYKITDLDSREKNIYAANGLTRYLLNNSPQDIFRLTKLSLTDTNNRHVYLDKNIIRQRIDNDNPSGSTYYGFLISKTARYLGRGAGLSVTNRLTEEDFTDIYPISVTSRLLATVDYCLYKPALFTESEGSRKVDTTSLCGYIIFATMDRETKEISAIKTAEPGTYYNFDNKTTQYHYDLYERLPALIKNNNIAIIYVSEHANQAGDITINLEYEKYLDDEDLLPAYWEEELSKSISAIRLNAKSVKYDVGKTICFITDCHWNGPYNPHHSPKLVKRITDACNIDYFVNGGDMIYSSNTNGKQAAIDELSDCIGSFRTANIRLPMICIRGNHDNNLDGSRPEYDIVNGNTLPDGTPVTDAQERAALKALYEVTRLEHHNIVFKSWMNYYNVTKVKDTRNNTSTCDLIYWEDDVYRYGVIYWYNTASRQVSWAAELFNTQKPVVIFNHGLYIDIRHRNKASDKLQERWLLNTLQPYQDQIRCIIQGHAHCGGLRLAYNGKVPIICVDCDLTSSSWVGTVQEQAFAIITLRERDIAVVSVGRGCDYVLESGTKEFYVQRETHVMSSCYDIKTITPNNSIVTIEDAAGDVNVASVVAKFLFTSDNQQADLLGLSLYHNFMQDSGQGKVVPYSIMLTTSKILPEGASKIAGGELDFITGELKITHVVEDTTVIELDEPVVCQVDPISFSFVEDYNQLWVEPIYFTPSGVDIVSSVEITKVTYAACEVRYNPIDFFN